MKQAVIFDLDGTLADTLSSIAFFANRALVQCGYEEIPLEEYAISSETARNDWCTGCLHA